MNAELEAPLSDLGLTQAQDRAVRETLAAWNAQKQKLARAQMRLAARGGAERRLLKDGEVKMMIHPTSYHYWGQRLGYQCWEDKQFCAEYLRDNPEARVRSQADHLTVRVDGGLADRAAKRFRKTYPNART